MAEMITWLCLDLETCDAPQDAIESAIKAWKPPGNVKDPDKIETRRQEAAERIREKAALLDASPIICIAIITDQESRMVLNGMDAQHHPIDGWNVIPCGDEAGLLQILRDWLNTMTGPDTTIVGHNHRGFDIPKVRQAYIRHELKLPEILRPRMDDDLKVRTVDTMRLVQSFSMENRDERYISLDTVATVLSIHRPKQVISGADVPGLYRQRQYQAICTYCAIDCTTTARAYMLMSGQAPDLK